MGVLWCVAELKGSLEAPFVCVCVGGGVRPTSTHPTHLPTIIHLHIYIYQFHAQSTHNAGAIDSLVRWYCREAGVRNLEKHIEKVFQRPLSFLFGCDVVCVRGRVLREPCRRVI